MNRPLSIACMVVYIAILANDVRGQNHLVDYRWSPENFLTVIGLPDDWQKTMATENGSLAYDFGPGPYARNLTSVNFGLKNRTLTLKQQQLPDGKTPIVKTTLAAPGIELNLTSFAVVPEEYVSPKLEYKLTDKVTRLDGLNGARGWATPASGLDPAFANVAWGTNRAIRYRVKVDQGQKYQVATGFLEGWKSTAGARPLEIHVEGSQIKTIDPLADGVKGRAYVHLTDGIDADEDGFLSIEIHPSATGPDPNTILNVFWVFSENFEGQPDAIAAGSHNRDAIVYFDCGLDSDLAADTVRYDIIHASTSAVDSGLILTIATNRVLSWSEGSKIIYSQRLPFILLSHPPVSVDVSGREWKFNMPTGVTEAYAVVASGAKSLNGLQVDFDVSTELSRAETFWKSNLIIPNNAIEVPDSSIQFLADASLRNMYQVREFVNGKMQFHPGPSVYRGLWVTDFNIGAALATNDTTSVRIYIEAILNMPTEDGHFRAMVPNLSLYENPTFLTPVFHYARSTGNLKWLAHHWTTIERGMDWMLRQRESTLKNPEAPNYGLLPAGFVDGGISELNADYGSAFWTLTAIEYGIHAARSIGRHTQASMWQGVFDDMLSSLINAMERDLQYDVNGIQFLPTVVGAKNPAVPQLGSYGFIWPAKFSHFMHDTTTTLSSVVDINLSYYETQLSQGLLSGAGWLSGGLWHWLSAMHGSVQLEHGWRDNAIETLYALSNHASPTGVWVEEQLPAHLGNRTTGDVSNAQSSAAYFMFVRDLIAYEREDEIVLFAGVPKHWLEPGKSTKLMNSHTLFGPLSVNLETTPDGQVLTVNIEATNMEQSNGRIIIDPRVIREAGFNVADNLPTVQFGNSLKYTFHKE